MSTQTATLTFDMTDPDARAAFDAAYRALDVRAALRAFDNYLHDEIEHNEEKCRADADEIRTRLYDIMSAHGVNIHE